MSKVTIISIIGIVTLLFSQAYWLYNTYKEYELKNKIIIEDLFSISLSKEVGLRWLPPQNPHKPRMIVKKADKMTPEERENLKGDTIYLNMAEKENIGKSYAEVFMQVMQNESLKDNPPRMELLDSIFRSELAKNNICANFQILFLNKKQEVIDSTKNFINKEKQGIFTITKPIGTQGLRYMQAFVEMPPAHILKNMLYSLIVSFLIVFIVFSCLYYQLVVIHQTRTQLQEREKAVHGAIHDLKSPLSMVYTTLDFIENYGKDKSQQKQVTLGKTQIRRLSETIESMLNQTKMHKGKTKLNKMEIDLIEKINYIKEGLDILYSTKQYTFKIDNQLKKTTISTDAVRLERCICNLIENALKYSDEGVEITVILSADHKQLNIAVKDTGWGIPKEVSKKIGTQFFRVKYSDKPAISGYGIGLNSTQFLLSELGGKLTFISEEGKGSTFFIHLPH